MHAFVFVFIALDCEGSLFWSLSPNNYNGNANVFIVNTNGNLNNTNVNNTNNGGAVAPATC